MRIMFLEYVKLRKTGLIKSGNILLVLLLAPSIIGVIISSNSNINYFDAAYSFTMIIDILLACLVPLIMTNRYNSGKFLFYCTLPIRNVNLIEYLYFETYTVIIVGFFINGVIYSIQYGMSYLIMHCFKLILALCLNNLFIPMLSSGEFKRTDESMNTGIVAIITAILLIVTFIITIALAAGTKLIDNCLNNGGFKIVILSLSAVLALICILTVKKSYFHTLKKVRLIQKSVGHNINIAKI